MRQRATQELWSRWFRQRGILGLEMLQRAQTMLQAGDIPQAELLLTKPIADLQILPKPGIDGPYFTIA